MRIAPLPEIAHLTVEQLAEELSLIGEEIAVAKGTLASLPLDEQYEWERYEWHDLLRENEIHQWRVRCEIGARRPLRSKA